MCRLKLLERQKRKLLSQSQKQRAVTQANETDNNFQRHEKKVSNLIIYYISTDSGSYHFYFYTW